MASPLYQVGWIGTGVMGRSMCKHLINSKTLQLSVTSRTISKCQELADMGATVYPTARDMILEQQKSNKPLDALVLMVGTPHDVKSILLEQGVSDGQGSIIDILKEQQKTRSGKLLLVDHTTSAPNLAREIANLCKDGGIESIDAPVSGGDIGARNGQLSVMCGADDEEGWNAGHEMLFRHYSKLCKLLGPAGSGQHCKMANQIAIASCMVGVCESMIYASKAGLSVEKVVETISGGAAASFSLTAYAPRILKGDYEPGFFVEHFVKDLGICLDECRAMNIALPGLALADQLYRALIAQGGAKNGTQALIKVLQNMNSLEKLN